jgi:predicted Zn-dependent protease
VQAHGLDLNGFYEFDEEGIPAERVSLVEKGLLKGFLLSRTPVEGFARSNGHGRAEMGQKPQARMGTTIVNARGGVSEAELKRLLIAEAKKQGKPYGLILRDVAGGQTSTETGGYQAFKGAPRMVYTVDVKTGEERLVRGVEIVGTPLSALSRILAAGTDPRVFNGYCGAESGYVPVSTIAPALLLSEIELQRSSKERQRAPLLPRP